MFEQMIELIEGHASYGPAMKEAARGKEPLILDYHTHGRGTGYCVSIAKKKHNPLRILGEDEAQCDELMGAFGRELAQHYQLQAPPLIYLNGKPHPGP
jgi:hypothetical protein